jgi:type I restriction enzyme, S subunit
MNANHADVGTPGTRERWPRLSLREISARLDYGVSESASFDTTGPRLLRITDIQNGAVNWNSVPACRQSAEQAEPDKLLDGDIVIARTGGTVGKSFLVRRPPLALHASYLLRLRTTPNCDPEFVYAFLQSDDYWKQLRSHSRGGAQPNVNATLLGSIQIPFPDIDTQRRLAGILNERMRTTDSARAESQNQKAGLQKLLSALLRNSLATGETKQMPIAECLVETSKGVGERWTSYPVLGATRAGLAPAKEGVGKNPQRYKLVDEGTIFYNPMRILLGSIAMIDSGDSPGITSPDYVVFKCRSDVLHHRWFYHWLRSHYGEMFIKGLTRGAVRERLLFKRLAMASIEVPSIDAQHEFAEQVPLIQEAISRTDEQIDLVEKLPASYLRRAFAGGL